MLKTVHVRLNFQVKILHRRHILSATLEIATDTVTDVTNIFSWATKNSGLLTTLVTRFLYDIDLN